MSKPYAQAWVVPITVNERVERLVTKYIERDKSPPTALLHLSWDISFS